MYNRQINPTQSTILVVEDTRPTLNLLVELLSSQGYQAQGASNGPMALSTAQADPPDLILLDIMMPHMDGYQVCERLKADERTRDIPVIFISAMDETWDKIKAFSLGGVDYISKPFETEEVIARINTHLMLGNLQKKLQRRVAELDAFAHTVAHDLKNPLGVIVGYAGVLVDNFSNIPRDKRIEGLQNIYRSGQKATNIVNELLLLASVHQAEILVDPFNMGDVVAQAQQRLSIMITEYQAEIILPDTWPLFKSYAPWIEEVWVNYLSNGLKYGGRPPRLELGTTSQSNGAIRFWVRDNGSGLTPEAQDTLFTEFTRLHKTRAEGHGLGLSIVRRIVEKLGGQVGVDREVGRGSEFYFTLPAVEEGR